MGAALSLFLMPFLIGIIGWRWTFCDDIGGANSGAVSASMNMVGNIGAAISAIAFLLFADANHFFFTAAALNVVSIGCWCLMNPYAAPGTGRPAKQVRVRFAAMITFIFLLTGVAVGYNIYRAYKKNSGAATAAPVQVVEPEGKPAAAGR